MNKRVALITGAASGQGSNVAKTLATDGFAVGLVDIDEVGLNKTASQIVSKGGQAICLVVDVSNRTEVEDAIHELESVFGPPWVIASSAAILEGGFVIDMPEEHWKKVLDVNYLGTVNVNAIASKSMIKNGQGGRILNWSSVSTVISAPGFAAYASSKAAVESFSLSLALELAPNKITVNIIRPGSIKTPMMREFDEQDIAEDATRIPLGRWGLPSDVSAIVRFLVKDEASWITGSVITIDGGLTAAAGSSPIELVKKRIEKRKKIENI